MPKIAFPNLSRTVKNLALTAVVAGFATTSVVLTFAAESSNRIAANKLSSNRLAGTHLSGSRLATYKLSNDHLEANPETAEILNTVDGREVYSYMINCAVPAGKQIEATIPDAADIAPPDTLYTCKDGRCSFPGALGLAEHWIDRPLSPKGQRWVSACLFARVNAYGVTVKLSMRGDAPSLYVSPKEMARFSLQEGAFYGNIFSDPDEPLDWNACRGKDQAAGEKGDLRMRDCTEPDPKDPTHTKCDFKYTGDCGSYGESILAQPRACSSYESEEGTYSDCIDRAESTNRPPRNYHEVITIYVKP